MKTSTRIKQSFLFLLCTFVLIGCCACAAQNNQDNQKKLSTEDQQICDNVLNEFQGLANVPRPSNHEEKIADYLVDWAKKHNFLPTKDSVNNVIFDVPATSGMENKPLVVLQCHSDMVFAQNGNEKDPLTTPIKIKNDGQHLTADGTSLGADDGIGCAVAMAAIDGKMKHGPLRLVFTTAEETDKTGAVNIDPKYFQDVKNVINIDNENCNSLTISSAAQMEYTFTAPTTMTAPTKEKAVKIKISDCKGGHSAIEINKNRINAIIAMTDVLNKIKDSGISFEYTDFTGGYASNAIPTTSEVVLVCSSADTEKIQKICEEKQKEYKDKYSSSDGNVTITAENTDTPSQVVSEQDYKAVSFANTVFNGVNTMSSKINDLVESSSNLGIISVNKDGMKIVTCVRSSEEEKLKDITDKQKNLATSYGMTCTDKVVALPWPANPESTLTKIAQQVYKEQNNKDIITEGTHGGLECGNFMEKNPNLDIISIGATIHDCHTVNETLDLDSVPVVWKLLEGILDKI